MAIQLQGGQYIDLSAGDRQAQAMRQGQMNEFANQVGAERQRQIAAVDAQVAPYIQQYGMEGFAVLNPELAARWASMKGLPVESLKPALQAGFAMRQDPNSAPQVLEQLRNTTGWNQDQALNTMQALTQYRGQPKPAPAEQVSVGGSLQTISSGGGNGSGGGGTPAPTPNQVTPNRTYSPVPSTDFDPISMMRGGKPSVDMQQQNKAVGSTEGKYAYGDVMKKAAETTQAIAALKETIQLEANAGTGDPGLNSTKLNELQTELANYKNMMANIASTPEGLVQKAKVEKEQAQKLLASGKLNPGQAEEARKIIVKSDAILKQNASAVSANKTMTPGANPPASGSSASTPAPAVGGGMTTSKRFILDASSSDPAFNFVKRGLEADVKSGNVDPAAIDAVQAAVLAPDSGAYFDQNGKITGPKRAELEKMKGGAAVIQKYEAMAQHILTSLGPNKTAGSVMLTLASGGFPEEAKIARAADTMGKTVSDPGKKLTQDEFWKASGTTGSYADYTKSYDAQKKLYAMSKSQPMTTKAISDALSPSFSSLIDGLVSGDPILTALYPGRAGTLAKLNQAQMDVLKTGTEIEKQKLANELTNEFGRQEAQSAINLSKAQAAYYLAQANAEYMKFQFGGAGMDTKEMADIIAKLTPAMALLEKNTSKAGAEGFSAMVTKVNDLLKTVGGAQGAAKQTNMFSWFPGQKEIYEVDTGRVVTPGVLNAGNATVLGQDPVGSIMTTVTRKTNQ